MSGLLMGRAFYADIPAHLKLTLLALCDWANDEGTNIYAAQATIARKCGTTDRSIRTHLTELIERGLLARDGRGSHGQIRHRVIVEALPRAEDISALFERATDRKSGVEKRKPVSDKPLDREVGVEVVPTASASVLPTLASRPEDAVFEVLFELDAGLPYTPENRRTLTKTAADAVNIAASEIRRTGISGEELRAAIAAWPTVMGDATCTANAVKKHLPRLRAAANGLVARRATSDLDDSLEQVRRMREERRVGA